MSGTYCKNGTDHTLLKAKMPKCHKMFMYKERRMAKFTYLCEQGPAF